MREALAVDVVARTGIDLRQPALCYRGSLCDPHCHGIESAYTCEKSMNSTYPRHAALTSACTTSAIGVTAAEVTDVRAASMCPSALRSVVAKYSALHRSAVEALRQGKSLPNAIIVYYCPHRHKCAGFGDRIVGLLSVAVFALRWNAIFFIDWPDLAANFIPADGIDWRWHPSYGAGRSCHAKGPLAGVESNDGDVGPQISADAFGWAQYGGDGACVLYTGNRGAWARSNPNFGDGSDIAYSPEHVNFTVMLAGADSGGVGPSCLLRYLLAPGPMLLARANGILSSLTCATALLQRQTDVVTNAGTPRDTVVAVTPPNLYAVLVLHVRVGDRLAFFPTAGEAYRGVADRAADCLATRARVHEAAANRGAIALGRSAPRKRRVVALIVSDSPTAAAAVAARVQSQVSDLIVVPTLNRPPVHIDAGEHRKFNSSHAEITAEDIAATMAEWVAIAAGSPAEVIIGDSAFGRTAGMFAAVDGTTVVRYNEIGGCLPRTIVDLGVVGSGV